MKRSLSPWLNSSIQPKTFMNAEEAIIAKKRKRAERMEPNPTWHSEKGPRPKKGRTEDKKDRDNRKTGPPTRNQNYTPFNAPLDQVLMQIKDDPSLKWPEKMKGDPNKCNKNIVASIGTMGMTRTNVMTWNSRLRISSNKESWDILLERITKMRSWSKDGRIVTAPVKRDKGHHRRDFSRTNFQIKEDVS